MARFLGFYLQALLASRLEWAHQWGLFHLPASMGWLTNHDFWVASGISWVGSEPGLRYHLVTMESQRGRGV